MSALWAMMVSAWADKLLKIGTRATHRAAMCSSLLSDEWAQGWRLMTGHCDQCRGPSLARIRPVWQAASRRGFLIAGWLVRTERLELSHLSAPEPKSGASTNSATFAKKKIIDPTIYNCKSGVKYHSLCYGLVF